VLLLVDLQNMEVKLTSKEQPPSLS
jgi:hypothetical protein